jgi:phosphatidate phosphatase PAH1
MRTLWINLALLAACGSRDGVIDAPKPATDAGEIPRARFRDCTGRAYTAAPTQEWRHTTRTPLTLEAGAPNHSGQDQIESTTTVTIPGKFTYGSVSKDLEDELVRVSIDDCSAWRALGDFATNTDGRISVPVPSDIFTSPGVHEVRQQVLGDASMTTSYVWVLPRGTHIALTDIDGTMTQSDSELFQQIFDGSHVPVPYPGAVDLTTTHRGRGHVVFYLTGRPYWLTQKTRDWVRDLAFAKGGLHVTDSNGEALPSESGVGDFKKAYIESLLGKGYEIDVAYGNASTDIYAYLGAGLLADNVWIIGSHGGEQGTHAATDSWTARVAEVAALPTVTQPFDW